MLRDLQGFPDVSVGGKVVEGNWGTALLFGVSSAMLGVSGFESSSQVNKINDDEYTK